MTTPDYELLEEQSRDGAPQSDNPMPDLSKDFKVEMCNKAVASELPYYKSEDDRNNTYEYAPKGQVLIINNENFTYSAEKRDGTQRDVQNLTRLFGEDGYGYNITYKENLKASEMMNYAREFANNSEHEGKDCCIVIVLSHGAYDELHGVDYFPIVEDFEEILNYKKIENPLIKEIYQEKFKELKNAQNENKYNPLDFGRVNTHDFLRCFKSVKNGEILNAKHLANKPKIFFFQACRGSDYSEYIAMDNINKDLNKPSTPVNQLFDPIFNSDKKPIGADFIICYPTALKHLSYRNKEKGSWFITAICHVFSQFAPKEDLISMLTKVNKVIAKINGKDECENICIQSSEFTSSLINKFYFFPGVTSPDRKQILFYLWYRNNNDICEGRIGLFNSSTCSVEEIAKFHNYYEPNEVATTQNKIFAINSKDKSFEIYDLNIRQISRGTDPPEWRYKASVAYFKNKLYYLGGSTTRVDILTDEKWQTGPAFPFPIKYAQTITCDEILYVIDGLDNKIIYRLSDDEREWIKIEIEKIPKRDSFTAASLNGRIYITGGCKSYPNPNTFKSCLCFNPSAPVNSRISQIADMNYARMSHSLIVANGKLYAIGGFQKYFGKTFCNSIEEYDPQTDEWSEVGKINIE